MTLEAVPYEGHRKRYFEDLLAQKHRQLDYWAKRDDFARLEDIGMEISYIEDAISALESQRWIPVHERLPERDDRVLVYIPEIGGANCSIQISKGWSMKYVSHWMPLPQPPKEES